MSPPPARVYLLSPAHCGGKRAQLLLNPAAPFPLAVRLRTSSVPLGELFAFISGLYFRGKLAYAQAFARQPGGIWIITPNRGLLPPETPCTLAGLRALATTGIHPADPAYRLPLEASGRQLAATLAPDDQVILLGSLATPKYLAVLGPVFGAHLHYPACFPGLGDMARGSLLLRHAREGAPLACVPAPRA